MKHDLRRQMRARLRTITEGDRAAFSKALCDIITKDLPAWKSARRVMLFVPMRSEPDIRPLIDLLWQEKRDVILPWFPEGAVETGLQTGNTDITSSRRGGRGTEAEVSAPEPAEVTGAPSVQPPLMYGRHVRSWAEVHPGFSGFSQPNEMLCPVVPPESIDLALIPGQAFDAEGGRLGRGRGDYDRFLPHMRADAVLCGVCYETTFLSGGIRKDAGVAEEELPPLLPVEAHDIPMHAVATERALHFVKKPAPAIRS